MKKFLIINDPNLNLLGLREPSVYGTKTLEKIILETNEKCTKIAELNWFQSNSEGEIIHAIHSVVEKDYDALIINPAAYSHTSLAIFDALKSISIPIVEVHMTNIHKRESFRQTMLTAQAASIIMSGLGDKVYYHAVLTQLD